MSRDEKIGKLSRAVKEWRGKIDSKSGKWIRPPKPTAEKRVAMWLERLDLDVDESMKTLAGFKLYSEFYAWIQRLYDQKAGV